MRGQDRKVVMWPDAVRAMLHKQRQGELVNKEHLDCSPPPDASSPLCDRTHAAIVAPWNLILIQCSRPDRSPDSAERNYL